MLCTGAVEAFSELCCEVVLHPSYLAPLDGEFALQVHGGSTEKLHCTAKVDIIILICIISHPPGTALAQQLKQ